MSEQDWWLRFPEHCDAEVVRDGDSEPCGKPAIAVANFEGNDQYEPSIFAVCKHHARGRDMLSLVDIIRIAREGTK